jgi:hypothetical protein
MIIKFQLSSTEFLIAQRLANLYKQMDDDCRIVDNLDIQELYGVAAKNPGSH